MKNKVPLIIFTLFILFFMFSVFVNRMKKENEEQLLLETNIVTSARIVNFGYNRGGAISPPEYEFKIGLKNYRNGMSINTFCKAISRNDKQRIKAQSFPVLYYPSNPEVNKILVKRDDYKKYHVDYPDSLANFLNTYFECDF